MHETLIIAVPTLVVLLGILMNRQDAARIESRVDAGFASVNQRFDAMQRDMNQFYRTLGQHDARIEGVERKVSS